ncbi:MAG: hypothetical protein IKQ47_06150 [Prevotella sp.]|nr:hypothetical protein [Prevotella sp.]
MKRLFIPLIAVAVCLIACDDKKSKLDGYYAEIINEDLRNAIAEYDSIVMKDETEPYILEVHMESLGDTLTEYYITSGLSGSIFCKNNPILYVANVRGKDVIFFSESITARTNLVHVNNKIEEELKRRNFPALYKKEISGEKFMVTEKLDGLSCHVFFYKGEMIYKKTQVAAIPLAAVARMIAEKKLKTKESDDAF